MTEVLNMTVPGQPDYIKIIKMATGSAASIEGFDIEQVEDIKTAVAEGCKAITCHGFDGWSENYTVKMDMEGGAMTVRIEDDKCAHTIEKGDAKPCMDCPGEGDLGIQIMKSIMDRVEIERSGDGCRSIIMVKEK